MRCATLQAEYSPVRCIRTSRAISRLTAPNAAWRWRGSRNRRVRLESGYARCTPKLLATCPGIVRSAGRRSSGRRRPREISKATLNYATCRAEVIADVLPDQKDEAIRRLQEEGLTVAMAGDGINDTPAITRAHVGIAMGTGTDVATESAWVTLVKGDLRCIALARRLSRRTMANIKQNPFFAFVYNALGVPMPRGCFSSVWHSSQPHVGRGCNESELSFGHWECTTAAGR